MLPEEKGVDCQISRKDRRFVNILALLVNGIFVNVLLEPRVERGNRMLQASDGLPDMRKRNL